MGVPLQLILLFLVLPLSLAILPKESHYRHFKSNGYGDDIFQVGGVSYLANGHETLVLRPELPEQCLTVEGTVPLVSINVDTPTLTAEYLQEVISNYTLHDDVFNVGYLEAVYISSSIPSPIIDHSAFAYLSIIGVSHLFLDMCYGTLSEYIAGTFTVTLVKSSDNKHAIGPFLARLEQTGIKLSSVYRLYADTYRTFVSGIYSANDGSGDYKALGEFGPDWSIPMIPVPSRIYSWGDDRPLAGARVGVKDIYDVQGLKTTRGSLSYWTVTEPSERTAPAIQRIIDLGGVIVGKQKTSQFASAADPWYWMDVQHPFNPRGDGWLTCAASSAGGACSIAAYEWLDYAIGSDTGCSMRKPAAVAGIFGQRPSQGMMILDGVMPISYTTDTPGVFSRDPYKWVKFSRNWYTPTLYQDESITKLPRLEAPSLNGLPRRILYPGDYLPLNNSAAEVVLENFVTNVSTLFNMTVEKVNLTDTIEHLLNPAIADYPKLLSALMVLWRHDQLRVVADPLLSEWAARFDGDYPPLDIPNRVNFRKTGPDAKAFEDAVQTRKLAVQAYEENIQFSSDGMCSESIIIYDIGTGGKPSFREKELNDSPDAAYLVVPGTPTAGGNICSIFGCADFTLPIGQVPYFSNITFVEEMVPVTVNLVVKRGCDHVLYDLVEKLADHGVLKSVKTGKTAF
ncbi:amidase family protein [Xylogone sp. PMI_703]|nr:amidase family protein [Xylogone sp. PMI_703]